MKVAQKTLKPGTPPRSPPPPAAPRPSNAGLAAALRRNPDAVTARWKLDAADGVGCPVAMRVLQGPAVTQLRQTVASDRRDMAGLCRGGSITTSYVEGLWKKRLETQFALVAENITPGSATGPLLAYAICTMYNSYGGGEDPKQKPAPAPVQKRIVMLDLICTDEDCSGLGKAMLRNLIDVARNRFGADLLMLEATDAAAGFYKNFGFRRVPDACSFPAHEEMVRAEKAFAARRWPQWQSVAGGFRDAANGVWWEHYNRPVNQTVIMSLCLRSTLVQGGRRTLQPFIGPSQVHWQTPDKVLAIQKADVALARTQPAWNQGQRLSRYDAALAARDTAGLPARLAVRRAQEAQRRALEVAAEKATVAKLARKKKAAVPVFSSRTRSGR